MDFLKEITGKKKLLKEQADMIKYLRMRDKAQIKKIKEQNDRIDILENQGPNAWTMVIIVFAFLFGLILGMWGVR